MEEQNFHRDLLHDLLKVMRSLDESHAKGLFDLLRADSSVEQLRSYIDRTLDELQGFDHNDETISSFECLRKRLDVPSGAPPSRPTVMDLNYLCDITPFRVPAKPWTMVTNDDNLVSHLVSLYFTWDYPFYAFVDQKAFIRHMTLGNVDSDLCSPFLVNALLANACYYSQYSEAYVVPGDVASKGRNFLAEAERYLPSHQLEKGGGIRLASLQGALLLYERYAMSGEDDLGYTMLNIAIEMAEALGIINREPLNLSKLQLSDEMITSVQRTAWGVFQVDTVVHTNFLKPSRVSSVSLDRIDPNETGAGELWVPYPTDKRPRQSWLGQYFDEACKLSYLARDISRHLYHETTTGTDQFRQKQVFFNKLRQWERALPDNFQVFKRPPPHVLLLRMRYHVLIIGLARDGFGVQSFFLGSQEQQRTMDESANAISLASAREISALARIHREEYGMERAHQFATYAMMLALFTMLDDPSFDVLSHDFLSLTSAFSITASRSQVGRYLFHIFRQSVRSRNQEERVLQSDAVSDEVKELFGRHSWSQLPDRWGDYADGLERYRGSFSSGSWNYTASGVRDMLEMYERLSLGNRDSSRSRRPSSLNAGWEP
ncbi:pathway-specific regulatory protein [Aspergillus nomiae NRRL 13137]|uniref:Pathway-specific regulatory protein n=1 Tax=Aspergillus nomiae NRRL (strain ATCC 15546 / NRRL 13137 / CBS 260.88 / M93) TaxID=1509407 RepID=A0A0L1J440_ASPN3|nr:pathway-specific regulatory protein [Aspergillus nomiae NRRL 13137]KNG86208.1 pathway-specific regulatory protein [Aspergillus nomiae NRRL 13137]